MVFRLFNSLLNLITRPYFYLQQYILVTVQSYIPSYFDEKLWVVIFVLVTSLIVFLAYILSRYVTLRDADDDPVYQRTRLYSKQRQHRKMT